MNLSASQLALLISRARGGESEALGQLLEIYRSYVGLLARLQIDQRLQGKVSPSDVVQDTFIRARKYFSQFRGTSEAELLSWLRRNLASTVARLVRHYTTQRRDINLEQQLDAELGRSSQHLGATISARSSSPSKNVERREQAVMLAEALSRLEADYREVIVLRHLEGLSFPEVAKRMERTLDSVKNVWTRALAKLRESLGEP